MQLEKLVQIHLLLLFGSVLRIEFIHHALRRLVAAQTHFERATFESNDTKIVLPDTICLFCPVLAMCVRQVSLAAHADIFVIHCYER